MPPTHCCISVAKNYLERMKALQLPLDKHLRPDVSEMSADFYAAPSIGAYLEMRL